ncbi:hypothetical protein JOF53_004886 [Crossiella equi]|uniref:DUF805 domain-containing protein n=1 Tax=Crossiella equi TaxID=130796 RepID=A0ABS5AHG4_9PSEU|nr:hypothetical protein [Crossiella equi]MBP2476014.1 hypothetical protein [Crossiella equi]
MADQHRLAGRGEGGALSVPAVPGPRPPRPLAVAAWLWGTTAGCWVLGPVLRLFTHLAEFDAEFGEAPEDGLVTARLLTVLALLFFAACATPYAVCAVRLHLGRRWARRALVLLYLVGLLPTLLVVFWVLTGEGGVPSAPATPVDVVFAVLVLVLPLVALPLMFFAPLAPEAARARS